MNKADLLDRYVGSPIYGMAPEHRLAIVLVAATVMAAGILLLGARRQHPPAVRIVERYRALPSLYRFAAWLLAIVSAMNLGMGLGRLAGPGTWLIAVGIAEAAILRRLLTGRSWRWPLASVTVVALTVNLGLAVAGITVDQVGFLTALLEATVLAVVLRTVEGGRLRRLAASIVVVGAVGFTTLASWGGAVVAGLGGEKLGETPLPGVLLPKGTNRPPTPREQELADRFWRDTAAAIARYEDVAVAAADGYLVEAIVGSEFHAENPRYKSDGILLDPARPETLVYEETPDGPVLLGAMYEMEEIGDEGPMFAGPITVWHAHDHICFGVLPPAITGFESPLGACPLLSVSFPVTNEMMHVWTIPGVDDPYTELDEEVLDTYLEHRRTGP